MYIAIYSITKKIMIYLYPQKGIPLFVNACEISVASKKRKKRNN